MHSSHLEIHRSGIRQTRRLVTWLNFVAVVFALLLLVAFSYWTVVQSRESLRENIASKLDTILEIETEAVRQWMNSQKRVAGYLATDDQIGEVLHAISVDGRSTESTVLLNEKLGEISTKLGNQTCLLMTVNGDVVASMGNDWLVGQIEALEDQFCDTLMSGRSTASPVFSRVNKDTEDEFSIAVAAPIRSKDRGIVGFLGIGHNLSDAMTEVLSSSRSGATGETVAVVASGQLISDSRFSQEHSGDFPILIKPTRMINLDGAPDHRGVNSVMASWWLPEYSMGLVTKMDYAEATAPVNRIFYFVSTMFVLLLLTAFSTLFYRWYLMRMRQAARKAELATNRLGAYELEEKIGEGGMGVVYRARHALLRRPTAVKILPPEKSNRDAVSRFEQEVQFTSKLKHPNTISIYDYGRTENGLFYYAMELLDGMNLEQLVRIEGPLPDGRVMEILRQTCRSLREAHSLGLVHRDIKPANLMLCDRGGAYDTVKVLDFGMVRDRTNVIDTFVGDGDELTGTPIYMAPECFTNPEIVSSRVDIFALGAVAFFMLTGKPLFDVKSLDRLLDLHIFGANLWAKKQFETAIAEDGLMIDEDLIELVCRCLGRINDRPESVDEILKDLALCLPRHYWGQGSAEKWWTSLSTNRMEFAVNSKAESKLSASLEETQTFVRQQHPSDDQDRQFQHGV